MAEGALVRGSGGDVCWLKTPSGSWRKSETNCRITTIRRGAFVGNEKHNRRVKDIMSTSLGCLNEHSTLRDAVKVFHETKLTIIPIVQENQLKTGKSFKG